MSQPPFPNTPTPGQEPPTFPTPYPSYEAQPAADQQPYGQQAYGQPYAQQQPYSPQAYDPAAAYGQPAYGAQPGYGYAGAMVPAAGAPFGVDPMTGLPYSDKSKLTAGLLQIFLGGLGIGRFYLGDIGLAITQIIVTFVTLGFGSLWGFIDGIILLAGSPNDRFGRPLRP